MKSFFIKARRSFDLVAVVLLLNFIISPSELAVAADIYVDAVNGDDNNNGGINDPFATIQKGIDTASVGDTINVLSGTFNEQVEITDNDISLLGAGPENTLLVSTDTCTNQMNSSATAGVRLFGDHSGITLKGFSVSGYDLGLDIGENIGNTISDLTIEDVNASNNCVHGILSQAGDTDGVSIDNVTVNDNGSGFFAGRGLWFINGTKSDIRITNSTFNDNRLVGLDISDGDVTGVNITGNTVEGNGDKGIGVLGPQGPDANLVDNNTVTDNGRFGIEIQNPSDMTTVSNNTVSLTGPGSDTRDYAGIAVFRRSPGVTNADQPSGVTVTGNTITGFVEPNGDGEGFGIVVEGAGSVTENDVSGNDVGIQVQEGNPSPNTNGTDFFDRGDASVAANVTVNLNNITGNGEGMRAVGTTNTTDGTGNWWGDTSGPSGEGPGAGDSVSTDVDFCPWLDAVFPGGSPVDICDDDGDGASDAGEDSIGDGDGNGDNIPDSEQDTVASLFSENGNCELTLSVSAGMLQQVMAEPVPADAPDDRFRFPCQAIAFLVTGLEDGATVDLVLRIRPADDTLDTLIKPDDEENWQVVPGVTVNTTDDYTDLTFSLIDGGPLDADGKVDGVVTDPALPGAARSLTIAAPASIPTSDVWSLVLLAGVLGLLMSRHKRRA